MALPADINQTLAAIAAAVGTAIPVASDPADALLRVVLIIVGVVVGTMARFSEWFSKPDGVFQWRRMIIDFSTMGLFVLGGLALAENYNIGKFTAAAAAALAAYFGINFARKILLEIINRFRRGGTTPTPDGSPP